MGRFAGTLWSHDEAISPQSPSRRRTRRQDVFRSSSMPLNIRTAVASAPTRRSPLDTTSGGSHHFPSTPFASLHGSRAQTSLTTGAISRARSRAGRSRRSDDDESLVDRPPAKVVRPVPKQTGSRAKRTAAQKRPIVRRRRAPPRKRNTRDVLLKIQQDCLEQIDEEDETVEPDDTVPTPRYNFRKRKPASYGAGEKPPVRKSARLKRK